MYQQFLARAFVSLLAIALAFGNLTTGYAQDTSVTTDVFGRVVNWGGAWELSETDGDASAGIESVTLTNDDHSAMMVMIFTDQQLPREQAREALLTTLKDGAEDYSVIDSGDYDNLAYELTAFTTNDVRFGAFTLVYTEASGTLAYQIAAPQPEFGNAVAQAQESVTIDGNPTFLGIDGGSLAIQVGSSESVANIPTNTTTTTSNTTETQTQTQTQTSSGGSYTVPSWGYTVNYPSVWTPGGDVGDFSLIYGAPSAIIGFMALENPGGVDGPTMEALLVETFQDSLGVGGEFSGSASSSDRAVFLGVTAEGLGLIQEVIIVSPSTIVIVTLAVISDAESALAAAKQIDIDGIPIFALL